MFVHSFLSRMYNTLKDQPNVSARRSTVSLGRQASVTVLSKFSAELPRLL